MQGQGKNSNSQRQNKSSTTHLSKFALAIGIHPFVRARKYSANCFVLPLILTIFATAFSKTTLT